MRRILTVAAAVVAVAAISSMALAQTGTPTEKAKTEKTQAEKVSTKPAPLSMTGKVAKFDEATKMLTVTVKDADKTFAVNAQTKIHTGAKTLKATALVAGAEVKVTYTEAAGTMTATNIAVAAAQAATTPAKK